MGTINPEAKGLLPPPRAGGEGGGAHLTVSSASLDSSEPLSRFLPVKRLQTAGYTNIHEVNIAISMPVNTVYTVNTTPKI